VTHQQLLKSYLRELQKVTSKIMIVTSGLGCTRLKPNGRSMQACQVQADSMQSVCMQTAGTMYLSQFESGPLNHNPD